MVVMVSFVHFDYGLVGLVVSEFSRFYEFDEVIIGDGLVLEKVELVESVACLFNVFFAIEYPRLSWTHALR